MLTNIHKRDGRIVPYDRNKIADAVFKAMQQTGEGDRTYAKTVASYVEKELKRRHQDDESIPDIEEIQDIVEDKLMQFNFEKTAKAYILYRADRTRVREMHSSLMETIDEITKSSSSESNLKRENSNIDGNTAMGTMLQIGSAASKAYNENYLLKPEQAKAHKEGDIHIHDFDFYSLTETCCQIDLIKLFKGGFSTGHGYLREPQSIQSYAALAAIAIQANQNEMHGGQSIPNFDYAMAEGIKKSYKKNYISILTDTLEDRLDIQDASCFLKNMKAEPAMGKSENDEFNKEDEKAVKYIKKMFSLDTKTAEKITGIVKRRAYRKTDKDTYQAMEGFVHNLNTMHSRAGAQTPFSSINYGTDTSNEGRMAIYNILMALDAGMGHGETCIFPIHIFKVKEGVNFNEGDPNYDLFHLSCKVSAKRLFPNYVFIDAPFNLQYYRPGHPETEVATMGCRTRVMGNVYDPKRQIAYSRGNLSFTSINLPRLAIEAEGDEEKFYKGLDKMLNLVADQLLDRFKIQSKKHVYNYPFLMGQGIWLDSDKLKWDDEVGEVLKHGTLSIGFIGLAETLTALYGHHHGEGEEYQEKGLEIVGHMRNFCDKKSKETGLNFTLLATPAEGLAGRFVKMDRERYGEIPGVTDREYYTNSFHIPVWFEITAADKIRLEAPYHALCNAGHITYVELDGDTAKNVEAFENIIRYMEKCGIGYGSINHPVDRDPVCGYVGVINDVCPRCGRHEGEAISPEKIEELKKQYPEAPCFVGKV